MLNQNKIYKGITIILFLFLFIYLAVRVFLNETLHDEVATYMFFIYHGDYKGANIVWDANNHLLNSFIGNHLYPFFKDHLNWYRIPNLLFFVVYFFGIRKLTSEFKTKHLQILALVTFCTIPFIIEYFAYCRGYGLSLGFFSWALVHINKYLKNNSTLNLIYAYIFLLFTIASNVTFINTCFLIIAVIFIQQFILIKKKGLKNFALISGINFLFICSLIPFIQFSFQLKEHGALYYGSNEGIWDVTGKTISKYVLFWDNDILMYVYIILFILLIYKAIKSISLQNLIAHTSDSFLFYSFLFFGNIVAILLMAWVLEINYPEDRTGMYLIILFFFMIFYCIDQLKIGKYIQYLFLFFPIMFIFKMSIHTSVFSPDDRMTVAFYKKVKKYIKPEHSIMIYHIMNWNWPFKESLQKEKASVATFYNPNALVTDIIINKTTTLNSPYISKFYDILAYDPLSTYIAFKRKKPFNKKLKRKSEIVSLPILSNEYINIFESDSIQEFENKTLQITVKGHLQTFQLKNKIQLVVQTFDNDNLLKEHLYYSFETTYQGKKIDDDFLHHFVIEKLDLDEKRIVVYIWNRNFEKIKLNHSNCSLYQVSNL